MSLSGREIILLSDKGLTSIVDLISSERPSSHFMLVKKTAVPSGADISWSTVILDTTA